MSDKYHHVGYARETAMCVDLAYDSVEGDIVAELEHASGDTTEALDRVLRKLRARRAVLDQFIKPSKVS